VRHDLLCERDTTLATYLGSGCRCATRAYARDPLPDDVTPIYAEPKTPGQSGRMRRRRGAWVRRYLQHTYNRLVCDRTIRRTVR